MSKQSLVYICRADESKAHVGCGVVVSGGVVVTCRHVWTDAVEGGGEFADLRFPHPAQPEHRGRWFRVRLFDACPDPQEGDPDLVILQFTQPISGLPQAPIAVEERHQIGDGHVHAFLPSRDCDDEVACRIGQHRNEEGLRRLSPGPTADYWFERGSSGAPVYLAGGMQIAGILRERDLGGAGQSAHVKTGFVVPAATIWRHVERAVVKTEDVGLPVAELVSLLQELGHADTPVADIPRRLREAIAAQRAAAAEPVAPSNLGEGVDAAIGQARRALGETGAHAARAILDRKGEELAAEAERLRAARCAVLRERAKMERLALDYAAAKATYRELAALDPDDLGWAHVELGDLEARTGTVAAALDAYREAERRAKGDERRTGLVQARIGNMLARQGEVAAALASYRAGLAIDERRAAADPSDGEAQRDLATSHDKIGNMLARQGEVAAALASYRAGLAIDERRAAADPSDGEAQRDLSVSHEKVGDMLARQGEVAAALASYRAGLAIAEGRAAADPSDGEAQRDLSVSHEKVGDMLARQGDVAGALASYRAGLAIRERRAAADPSDGQAQRDLATSQIKIGDMLARQGEVAAALDSYRTGLTIDERRAAADPSDGEAQRDLSISHERIGDMLARQGEVAAALASYRAGLAIRERRAAADPSDDEAQRDLSVSHNKVGDMLARQGDVAAALAAYRAGLAIRERRAAADPSDGEAQRDLMVSRVKLSEVEPAQAAAYLAAALALAEALAAAGRLDPADAWMVEELRKRLRAAGG